MGLPSRPSWWMRLGADCTRTVGLRLAIGAPAQRQIAAESDGGAFIQTAPEPAAYERKKTKMLRRRWFPRRCLAREPRFQILSSGLKPARVRPAWTRRLRPAGA